MKKIIIILGIISFLSCNLSMSNPSGKMSFEEAIIYTRENIKELPEPKGEDIWQYPETTENLGTGDWEVAYGEISGQSTELRET